MTDYSRKWEVGKRYLVHEHTTYTEIVVLEISPSGERIKTDKDGWVRADKYYLDEVLPDKPRLTLRNL